jgi:OOP family OmpA-OmpF porin
MVRAAGVVLGVIVLAGCGAFRAGYDVENIRNVQAVGSDFTKALTEEYRQIALFEADEMYDWPDAGYFARKGLRTAAGEVVEPEQIADWNLPADKVDELTKARHDLVTLLDASARDKFPQLAGRAQGRFDCWIEQQEENHQPDHIAACRDEFYVALEKLRAAMTPEPEPMPAPEPEPMPMAKPQSAIIYFAFDSAKLSDVGRSIVAETVEKAKEADAQEFTVTGHADRAGPADYNMNLSLRRANAVREALVSMGVNPAFISIAGRGEAENAVPTADGVAEQANRRVELIVLQ